MTDENENEWGKIELNQTPENIEVKTEVAKAEVAKEEVKADPVKTEEPKENQEQKK